MHKPFGVYFGYPPSTGKHIYGLPVRKVNWPGSAN